jgi:lipopolysaccharide/colanic/teichoic acid biosynthesis glycosyltransferase
MSTNNVQLFPFFNRLTAQPAARRFGDLFKRAFDIFASALGLLILTPFFIYIAIKLKRESPGPAYYRGARMGRGGKIFRILKFRTMYERPESYAGARVTAKDDDRIMPYGQWLRDTKINELPQLWNVLIGEMSLVGPRPEDPEIVAEWPAEAREEILSMRPGITSPASVAYHDEESRLQSANVMGVYMESILPDKLRLDLLYVRHHDFITDLDVLFWTFMIFIPRLGKNKIPEGWLFGGPFARITRSYLRWFAIDFVLALIGIVIVGVLWRMVSPLDVGLWKALALAVVFAFLFGLFNSLFGLKTVSWSRAAPEDVLGLFASCGLVMLSGAILHFFFAQIYSLPANFTFTFSLFVLALCVVARYRLRLITGLATRWIDFRKRGYGTGERVLIIGAGEGSEFAAWLLCRTDFKRFYNVIGIADDDPRKQGIRYDGVSVLGTTADIPDLVKRYDIGAIFYAIAKISLTDSQRILAVCKSTGLHIVMISDILRSLHRRLMEDLPRCENICPYLIGSDYQVSESLSP